MCFRSLPRICHWGPLTAIGIIKCITGMTIHCSSMWWPPTTLDGILNTICFMSLAGLTLYNFLSAMSNGPGYLPRNWKPENFEDTKYMQYCLVCKSYKAPRSHHCRRCGKCILKMDHHCPWINNCVGWGNQGNFIAFLAFATIGSFHAGIILGCSLYKSLYRVQYILLGQRPPVYLGLYGTILCVLALGFAIGVVIAVGMLLFFQIRGVLRNRTGIEDWIIEKANHRLQQTKTLFEYPYDIGAWRNLTEVLSWNCQPKGNGIVWPVKAGCDQYTLTKEQLIQKSEKRSRSRLYVVVERYSGSWLPFFSYGFRTACHLPLTDEPRIRLDVDELVLVTRWRKYWMFGEKVVDNKSEEAHRCRGWFPRTCVVQSEDYSFPSFSEEKKLQ